MRARFEDREIREPFPPGYDTASKAQREELGALYVWCQGCGYETRFPIAAETR
jgi:RNase P subunit RPR2